MATRTPSFIQKRTFKDLPLKVAKAPLDNKAPAGLRLRPTDFIEDSETNQNINDKFLFAISDGTSFYKKTIKNTSRNSYLGNYFFYKPFVKDDFINRQIQLGYYPFPDPVIEERVGGNNRSYFLVQAEEISPFLPITTSNVSLQLFPDYTIEHETDDSEVSVLFHGEITFIHQISDFILYLDLFVDKNDGNGFQRIKRSVSDVFVGNLLSFNAGNIQSVSMGVLSFNFINFQDGEKIIEKGDKVRFVVSFLRTGSLLTFRADWTDGGRYLTTWGGGSYEYRTAFSSFLFFQRGF